MGHVPQRKIINCGHLYGKNWGKNICIPVFSVEVLYMKVHKNSLLTDTSVEHNLCHLDNIFQTLFTLFMECHSKGQELSSVFIMPQLNVCSLLLFLVIKITNVHSLKHFTTWCFIFIWQLSMEINYSTWARCWCHPYHRIFSPT